MTFSNIYLAQKLLQFFLKIFINPFSSHGIHENSLPKTFENHHILLFCLYQNCMPLFMLNEYRRLVKWTFFQSFISHWKWSGCNYFYSFRWLPLKESGLINVNQNVIHNNYKWIWWKPLFFPSKSNSLD